MFCSPEVDPKGKDYSKYEQTTQICEKKVKKTKYTNEAQTHKCSNVCLEKKCINVNLMHEFNQNLLFADVKPKLENGEYYDNIFSTVLNSETVSKKKRGRPPNKDKQIAEKLKKSSKDSK
jgi:hypothetical protein